MATSRNLNCTNQPRRRAPEARLLVELWLIDQQLQATRERRPQSEQQRANRERLIRNLVYEIKNPLGGIRGAAQFLENWSSKQSRFARIPQVIIRGPTAPAGFVKAPAVSLHR
ncbi:MAG: hypothetical protein IPN78_19025 [Candidatus Accumulibacter sp.]|nr:hypothetical protein [Candidatus Accumulibacter propinquus]